MKKLVLLSTFVVVSVLIGLGQANSESAAAPLSVAISSPVQVRTGQHLEIRVKFTNISDHELTFSTFYVEGTDITLHYDIRDSQGNLQERKDRDRDGSIKSVTLKPGQSEEEGTLVSQIFVMPPGEYTIQLSRDIPGESGGNVAKSNRIRVTVVP